MAQILHCTAEEYLSPIHLCGYVLKYSCLTRENGETGEDEKADDNEFSLRQPRYSVQLKATMNWGQP